MNRYSFLKEFCIDYMIKQSGNYSPDYRNKLTELSVAQNVAQLPDKIADELFEEWDMAVWEAVEYDWHFWARRKQIPPDGDWSIWLILAGRGFGKTRTGAEFIVEHSLDEDNQRIGLIGETTLDVADVMVLGEAGIMACSPPWNTPKYIPSKRRIEWNNGSVGITYAGNKPDILRGPSHHLVWLDEPAKYQYPTDAWDNMELGLRLGHTPQAVATTTPKAIPLLKDLIQDSKEDPEAVKITYGSTFENIRNLPKRYIDRIVRRYEGTRLGLQELYAQMLEDDPNALWSRDLIESSRVRLLPALDHIVVGVDPPSQTTECGIVVAGLAQNQNCYVLADLSLSGPPEVWAEKVLTAYFTWDADLIVAERNQGGQMVESVIRSAMFKQGEVYRPVQDSIPIELVFASKSKKARAEPISTLYSRGWIHHVGSFGDLEDELCTYSPITATESPNRLDALVWAITYLMLDSDLTAVRAEWNRQNPLYQA